ncbi:MAG: hypothetical protein U0Q19_10075 [Kineosporiaceae bacterium]
MTTINENQTTEQTRPSLSSLIVAALEATWAAIQARHPEIPGVVLGAGLERCRDARDALPRALRRDALAPPAPAPDSGSRRCSSEAKAWQVVR